MNNNSQLDFTELYNSTYSSTYAVAFSFVKNHDDACDLVQDSYLSAYNNIHMLHDASKFEKWVIQIVANKCKDYLKRKKPNLFSEFSTDDDTESEFDIEDTSQQFDPEALADCKETKEIIKNMLLDLPEDQRICLILYYGQDLKISQIAAALEISENTVKSRLNYGKKKLKEQVEEYEKNGTKLHSVSVFGLLPFIKLIFTKSFFPPMPIPPFATARTVAKAVTGKTVVTAASTAAKTIGATLTTKIIAGVVAVALTAGIGFGITKLATQDKNPNSDIGSTFADPNRDPINSSLETSKPSDIAIDMGSAYDIPTHNAGGYDFHVDIDGHDVISNGVDLYGFRARVFLWSGGGVSVHLEDDLNKDDFHGCECLDFDEGIVIKLNFAFANDNLVCLCGATFIPQKYITEENSDDFRKIVAGCRLAQKHDFDSAFLDYATYISKIKIAEEYTNSGNLNDVTVENIDAAFLNIVYCDTTEPDTNRTHDVHFNEVYLAINCKVKNSSLINADTSEQFILKFSDIFSCYMFDTVLSGVKPEIIHETDISFALSPEDISQNYINICPAYEFPTQHEIIQLK